MARFEKNVVWLYISMEDIVLAQGFESVDDLLEDSKSLLFWYFTSLPDKILQCAFVAVLIDEVDIVVGFDHFDEVDDIDVVFE